MRCSVQIDYSRVLDIKIPQRQILIRPEIKTSAAHYYDTVVLDDAEFNKFVLDYSDWICTLPVPEERFAFFEVVRKDGTHDYALAARLIKSRPTPEEQLRVKPAIDRLMALDKIFKEAHKGKNDFVLPQEKNTLDALMQEVVAMRLELQDKINKRKQINKGEL